MRSADLKTGVDFQTPMPVAEYMVSLLPHYVKTVLEPTPGLGNIVKALGKRYEVTAPTDYFLLERADYDAVVMNPPFSSKYAILDNAKHDYTQHGMRLGYEMLLECMEMTECVIALMPWFTISDSDVRLRTLQKYGIVSITALPRKTFEYARIQTCVLYLHKGFKGTSAFKVFNHNLLGSNEDQLLLFNEKVYAA